MQTMTTEQCNESVLNNFGDTTQAMNFLDTIRKSSSEELLQKPINELIALLPEQMTTMVLEKLRDLGGVKKKESFEVKGFRKVDQGGYDFDPVMLKAIIIELMENLRDSPDMHEAEIEKMQAEIAAKSAEINNIEFIHTREIRAGKLEKIEIILNSEDLKKSHQLIFEEEKLYLESVLNYDVMTQYIDDVKFKSLVKPFSQDGMDIAELYQKRMIDALNICKASKKPFPRIDQFPSVVLTVLFESNLDMIEDVQYFFIGYLNLLIGRKLEDHRYIYIIETAFEWESLLNGKLTEDEVQCMKTSILEKASIFKKKMEELRIEATV
ncbi:MAG: hypothetical protein ACRC0G_07890 [Fusobacteriaceae bacterium]